jgi:hypothetical protein
MTAVDASINTAPAARDLVRPLPLVSSVIGYLLRILIADETIRSHILGSNFLVFPGPAETVWSQRASNPLEAIQLERTDRSQVIEKQGDHD